MSEIVSFTVIGKPEPRGSKISVPLYDQIPGPGNQPLVNPKTNKPYLTPRLNDSGRPMSFMRDDNAASGPWMKKVQRAAREAFRGRQPFPGPLKLYLRFYLERPKYHFGTGKNAGVLKEQYAKACHTVRPDRLKLARAVEDALTQFVYVDDAQTVGGTVEKFYVTPGELPRVEIEVHMPSMKPVEVQTSLLAGLLEVESEATK